jgi:hypothetical protein
MLSKKDQSTLETFEPLLDEAKEASERSRWAIYTSCILVLLGFLVAFRTSSLNWERSRLEAAADVYRLFNEQVPASVEPGDQFSAILRFGEMFESFTSPRKFSDEFRQSVIICSDSPDKDRKSIARSEAEGLAKKFLLNPKFKLRPPLTGTEAMAISESMLATESRIANAIQLSVNRGVWDSKTAAEFLLQTRASYINNKLCFDAPLIGMKCDINQAGPLIGFALVILLLAVYSCLLAEVRVMKHIRTVAGQFTDCPHVVQLEVFNRLRLVHVLRTEKPPFPNDFQQRPFFDRRFFSRSMIIYLLVVLPLFSTTLLNWMDWMTYDLGAVQSEDLMLRTIVFENIALALIVFLTTLTCWRGVYAMSKLWDDWRDCLRNDPAEE